MGIFHASIFTYISDSNIVLIDSDLILNTLILTCILFGGLSIVAFYCPTSDKFVTYGSLYTVLSNILLLVLLNLYIQNELFELCLMCIFICVRSLYLIKEIHRINDDNYGPVYHALSLFLDFVNFFADIGRILKREKEIERKYNKNKK